MTHLTSKQVESILGISEPTRQRMSRANLLQGKRLPDNKRVIAYKTDHIMAFRNAQNAPQEEALIARVGVRKLSEGTSEINSPASWEGWDDFLPEPERGQSVSGPWNISRADTMIGGVFVPSMSEWSLGAYRVIGFTRYIKSYVRLELSYESELFERWRFKKVGLGVGPVGTISWPRP